MRIRKVSLEELELKKSTVISTVNIKTDVPLKRHEIYSTKYTVTER